MLLADVALPVPIAHAFTYTIPDHLAAQAVVGARVICPFRARRLMGVVLAVRSGERPEGARALAGAVDAQPAVPSDLLAFLCDLAEYYLAPIGEVVRLALPPVERKAAQELTDLDLFERPRGIGSRQAQWVAPTDKTEPQGLSGQAAAILAHVRALGAEPITRLEGRWRSARAAVRRLSDLGLVVVESRDAAPKAPFGQPADPDVAHEPTTAQAAAVDAIEAALRSRKPKTLLLHGVTGSGKTEVYFRAIAAARSVGGGSIVLVPEIALTPQLVARFRARFGDNVAVLHSGLTARDRHSMWSRLREGQVDVAIGARSAVFAPVRDLALVVVDEEHDPSFKQEEGVRYHARDMAILRAHRASGVCVLGSATPSLESENLARTGRATKLRLPDRAGAHPLPRVELIDLRRNGPGPTLDRRISMPLFRAIEETLRAHDQVILFLNRRGFAPSVRCTACGEMATCKDCSVALTYHKHEAEVRCHYCDFRSALAVRCAKCGAEALTLEGLGTEKLEETLAAAFPDARVARLDRDVASGRQIEATLERVRNRQVDILVGTQMVTKGHDLPNVTLVGVVNADAALSIPDYRASERTFQLLVQVAGRAGRGDAPGRVLIQTWTPEHPAIAFAARHDVDGFLERELQDRRELDYPPLTRSALVRVDAADEKDAREACSALAQVARACDAVATKSVVVQGPAPAPVARVRGRYRFRIMLRARERSALRAVLVAVDQARETLPREVRASIDVDPVQLL